MTNLEERLVKIAETSAEQTAAMQQLIVDLRAAEQELLAAESSSSISEPVEDVPVSYAKAQLYGSTPPVDEASSGQHPETIVAALHGERG